MLWLHQRPSNKSEGDSILLSREMHYWLLSVQPCPGQLVDYPSSTACRIAVLGDNSIVEQTVTPSNLCAAKNIHRLDSGLVTCSLLFPYPFISYMYYRFQLGIARKYRVAGRVSCCYTSGCNKDIFSAMGSVETQAVPSPSEAFQTRPLLQVRDFKNMEINLCILFISGSKYWKHKKWVNITQVFLDSMVFKLIQYFHFFIFLLALMNKDYIIIHLSFFWVIQLYLSIISCW